MTTVEGPVLSYTPVRDRWTARVSGSRLAAPAPNPHYLDVGGDRGGLTDS